MCLFSVRDELVQEMVLWGLVLVYEKGDVGLKSDLIKDLVVLFIGFGFQIKVEEEMELFDVGVLLIGDGKFIMFYKDIVSFVNEVGDFSLVYKFMFLVINVVIWLIRLVFGRFGFSNIFLSLEVDFKFYLKLYCYCFDLNINV